jgi:hypothetical protein
MTTALITARNGPRMGRKSCNAIGVAQRKACEGSTLTTVQRFALASRMGYNALTDEVMHV